MIDVMTAPTQKIRVATRRKNNLNPRKRDGSDGYDDPGEKFKKKKKRGPNDAWLAHHYMKPVEVDDVTSPSVYATSLERTSRQSTRKPKGPNIITSTTLQNKNQILAIYDPSSMPQLCSFFPNTEETFYALVAASARTPWIHYRGTQNSGIFRMDIPNDIWLSDFAESYLMDRYGINLGDKSDPETLDEAKKEALLLAGLDPNLSGTQKEGYACIEGNKRVIPQSETPQIDYSKVKSIELMRGVLEYLGLDDQKGVLDECNKHPQLFLPSLIEDDCIEIKVIRKKAYVTLRANQIQDVGDQKDLDDTVYGIDVEQQNQLLQNVYSTAPNNPESIHNPRSTIEFIGTIRSLLEGRLHPQPLNYPQPD